MAMVAQHEFREFAQGRTETPRILLVDDDLTFGKIMTKVAGSEKIPMVFCSSVREVEELEDPHFDIAVIDYDLGLITGVQLAQYLERVLNGTSVILVSQYRGLGSQQHWPNCVKDFLHKSVGPYGILTAAFRLYSEEQDFQTT